jgi:hypothetical protein
MTRTPQVGDRYVATDNDAAARALGLPIPVTPLTFVTVSTVFEDRCKALVSDDELWVSFEDLERCFRIRSVLANEETADAG